MKRGTVQHGLGAEFRMLLAVMLMNVLLLLIPAKHPAGLRLLRALADHYENELRLPKGSR